MEVKSHQKSILLLPGNMPKNPRYVIHTINEIVILMGQPRTLMVNEFIIGGSLLLMIISFVQLVTKYCQLYLFHIVFVP